MPLYYRRRDTAGSVLKWRLKGLAGAYANIFRAESLDDDYMDPDYMRSSRYAFEMLEGAFRRNYSDEIGEKAALRVLRATSRTYILYKYSLRIGLLLCFTFLLTVHGVATATLLQTLLYLSTRPLAWFNRGRGARVAERVLQYRVDSPRGTPAVRRALRAEISSIPAQALYSWRWKEHLEELLPVEEDVREIALKLANQYEGSLRDLTETSWSLAR